MAKRGPTKAVKHYWTGEEGDKSKDLFPGEAPFQSVAFVFNDAGKTVLRFKVSDLTDSLKAQAICHGLHQKIGDAYAQFPDVSEAIEAAEGVMELLKAGEWEKESKGGPRLSELREAVNIVRQGLGKPAYTEDQFRAEYTGEGGEAKRAGARKNELVKAALSDLAFKRAEARRNADRAAADAATSTASADASNL